MRIHSHLTEFNDDLAFYKDVRIFYVVPGIQTIWQERFVRKNAEIDETLVLVKVRGKFYRYQSPQRLDVKLGQIELAQVIQRKLLASLPFQMSMAISGVADRLRIRDESLSNL